MYVLRRSPDILEVCNEPKEVGETIRRLTDDKKFAKRITKLAKEMEIGDDTLISSEKNNHRNPIFFACKSKDNLKEDERQLC